LGASGVLTLLAWAAQPGGLQAPALPNLLLIALIATALEQCSSYGIDNLTVPITTAWLWQAWA